MSNEKVQPQTMADLVNEARRKQETALSDPAYQEKAKCLWELCSEIKATKRKIAEWEGMDHSGKPSEAKIKDEKLDELRNRLVELEGRLNEEGTSATTETPESGEQAAADAFAGAVKVMPPTQPEGSIPWQIADPKDPDPVQPWYIPARYFARQLVIGDSTLLTKRNILADKTAQSLVNAGIKNSRGKVKFDPGTILKAFANVTLG